jgi:hypothetical protein
MFRKLTLLFWMGLTYSFSGCAHQTTPAPLPNVETQATQTVLMKYIDGTSQGRPEVSVVI